MLAQEEEPQSVLLFFVKLEVAQKEQFLEWTGNVVRMNVCYHEEKALREDWEPEAVT